MAKTGDTYTAGDKITVAEKYSYTNLNGAAVTDVPAEFNSGKDSVTVTKDNVTYYLQAKITGKQRAGINTGSSGVTSTHITGSQIMDIIHMILLHRIRLEVL